MQITRKSAIRQIQNLAPVFVTPQPTFRTLVDMLDVYRVRARYSQTMSNLQILIYRVTAHAFNKGTKKGLALQLPISPRGWDLKTLKTMLKTRPHQESLEKNLCGWQFFAQPHSFAGLAGRKPATFSENVHECVLNHLHV